MNKVLTRILRKPTNISILVGVSAISFIAIRLIPFWQIINNSFMMPGISPSRKIILLFEYIIVFFTDLMFVEQITTIILSLVLGVNVVLFIEYIKKQRKVFAGKSFAGSTLGVILGIFGAGCVSCGALVIAPLLTAIGLGSYIEFFSYNALLISWIGIVIILLSSYYLLSQIKKPLVC